MCFRSHSVQLRFLTFHKLVAMQGGGGELLFFHHAHQLIIHKDGVRAIPAPKFPHPKMRAELLVALF